MASISLEDIGKTYDDGTHAVGQVYLEIEDGEFLVLGTLCAVTDR